MENLLDFYQNVQSRINPDIFQIGFFSLRWYSLMYLVGFLVIFLLLMHRIKKDGMVDLEIPNLKSQIPNKSKIQNSYLPADAAKFKIFITDL
ncbi:MAG TPA: hypothetical protein DIT25_01445, partial [Candidatus Moranbacteria bacterium]|nr:hypothetical protein [Candidatus Moranbacteria bacterium]